MRLILIAVVLLAAGCGGRMCTRKIFTGWVLKEARLPHGGTYETNVPTSRCVEWTEADGGVTHVR